MSLSEPLTHNYSLKPNKRIYAIGDIHGYVDALEEMQSLIQQDIKNSAIDPFDKNYNVSIVYLGDYIDRGPHSAAVIDNLLSEQQRVKQDGINRHFICGNHDLYLLKFAAGMSMRRVHTWFRYGGINTLKSYGMVPDELAGVEEIRQMRIEFQQKLPKSHRAFVESMPFCHVEDGYLFAHAGVNPKKDLLKQSDDDLTYIREPFLSWDQPLEKCVVHGHTISQEPDVRLHRIGIDVGVFESQRLGCVVLEENKYRFLYSSTKCDVFDEPERDSLF